MSKTDKILEKVMSGTADANIAFADLTYLLQKLGAEVRQGKGSHILFTIDSTLLSLQSAKGKAKPYQVAQVREHLKTKRGLK